MKEENTLTAKEWLEKEGIYNSHDLGLSDQIENGRNPQRFDLDNVMEKYANYKNRILEEKIIEFGKLLKNEQIHATNENITIGNKMHNLLSVYNEHFNIQ